MSVDLGDTPGEVTRATASAVAAAIASPWDSSPANSALVTVPPLRTFSARNIAVARAACRRGSCPGSWCAALWTLAANRATFFGFTAFTASSDMCVSPLVDGALAVAGPGAVITLFIASWWWHAPPLTAGRMHGRPSCVRAAQSPVVLWPVTLAKIESASPGQFVAGISTLPRACWTVEPPPFLTLRLAAFPCGAAAFSSRNGRPVAGLPTPSTRSNAAAMISETPSSSSLTSMTLCPFSQLDNVAFRWLTPLGHALRRVAADLAALDQLPRLGAPPHSQNPISGLHLHFGPVDGCRLVRLAPVYRRLDDHSAARRAVRMVESYLAVLCEKLVCGALELFRPDEIPMAVLGYGGVRFHRGVGHAEADPLLGVTGLQQAKRDGIDRVPHPIPFRVPVIPGPAGAVLAAPAGGRARAALRGDPRPRGEQNPRRWSCRAPWSSRGGSRRLAAVRTRLHPSANRQQRQAIRTDVSPGKPTVSRSQSHARAARISPRAATTSP